MGAGRKRPRPSTTAIFAVIPGACSSAINDLCVSTQGNPKRTNLAWVLEASQLCVDQLASSGVLSCAAREYNLAFGDASQKLRLISPGIAC